MLILQIQDLKTKKVWIDSVSKDHGLIEDRKNLIFRAVEPPTVGKKPEIKFEVYEQRVDFDFPVYAIQYQETDSFQFVSSEDELFKLLTPGHNFVVHYYKEGFFSDVVENKPYGYHESDTKRENPVRPPRLNVGDKEVYHYHTKAKLDKWIDSLTGNKTLSYQQMEDLRSFLKRVKESGYLARRLF